MTLWHDSVTVTAPTAARIEVKKNQLLKCSFFPFLHVCAPFLLRRLFEVLCSKLQRRVLLLLDLAQHTRWQSRIYQSSTVSSQTAEMFSVWLSNNNTVFRLMSELRLHSDIHKYLFVKENITKYFLKSFGAQGHVLGSDFIQKIIQLQNPPEWYTFCLCYSFISNYFFTYLSMEIVIASWHKNQSQNYKISVSSESKDILFAILCSVSDDSVTQCSVDASGQHWTCSSGQSNFICSVDDSGRRILCMDEKHCPYAEESQWIQINLYVRTEHFLVESYSKTFFLSEIGETSVGLWGVFIFSAQNTVFSFIHSSFFVFAFISLHLLLLLFLILPSKVKPDKVKIRKVNSSMIEWSYPSSWSSPFSYFPLTFQIAQFKGRYKGCHNPCTDSKATEVRGPYWL